MTHTFTIGEDVEVYSYYTKQRGYGRQSLYVELKRKDIPFDINDSFIKDIYVMDVFPNILEHFQESYILEDYSFYDEDKDVYTDSNGDREYESDCVFKNITDLLNAASAGDEIEVEIEEEEEEI